jgi:hypothetical protein
MSSCPLHYPLFFAFFLALFVQAEGCAPQQFSESMGKRSGTIQLSVRAAAAADGTTISVSVINSSNDPIWADVGSLFPMGNEKLPLLYYGGGGNLCAVQAVVREPPRWEQGAPNDGIHVRRIEAGATLDYQFTIPSETREQVSFYPIFDKEGREARKSVEDQHDGVRVFECESLIFVQGFWRCKDLPAGVVGPRLDALDPPPTPLSSSVPGPDDRLAATIEFASLPQTAASLGRARTIVNAYFGLATVDLVDIQEIQAVSVRLPKPIAVRRNVNILGWRE